MDIAAIGIIGGFAFLYGVFLPVLVRRAGKPLSPKEVQAHSAHF